MKPQPAFRRTREIARENKACYGTKFHDALYFEASKEMKGKVFSFQLDSMGLECPDFGYRYKLPMAELTWVWPSDACGGKLF